MSIIGLLLGVVVKIFDRQFVTGIVFFVSWVLDELVDVVRDFCCRISLDILKGQDAEQGKLLHNLATV